MPRYHLGACLATTYASTSLSSKYTSSAPCIGPRPYACSIPPDLHSSTPPRPRARSIPPELPISIPLHINVPTSTAYLQTPTTLYLHVPGSAAYLPSSQSPYLYTSTCLRLQCTPRARELAPYLSPTRAYATSPPQRSRSPYLYGLQSLQGTACREGQGAAR